MKKNLFIIVLCLLMTFVAVSCDKEPEHEHSYGAEWKSDATNHWKECSCGEKTEVAAHIFGESTVKAGKVVKICSICSYEKVVTGASVVTDGASLQKAIAEDGINAIVLANDITGLSESLNIKKSIVIDMAGHKITATPQANDTITTYFNIFSIDKSDVTFEIKNSSATESVIEGEAVGKILPRSIFITNGIKNVKVIIGKNVKSNTAEGIFVLSGVLDVYGKVHVTTKTFAISGNATKEWEAADPGTIINLYEGAEVKSVAVVAGKKPGCAAIYQPQKGILNIKGATVEGYTGICIRSGELNISDNAVIKGIANDSGLSGYSAGRNIEGGAYYDGSAITICSSSSGYHGAMKISISNSTIESSYSGAIREAYTSADASTKLVSLKISGNCVLKSGASTLTCDLELKDASKAEITGGTFSKDPSSYVESGYKAKKSGDVWVVATDTTV